MSLFNGLHGILAQKFFASAFPGDEWREDGRRAVEGNCGKAELFMRMSLARFPIYRKELLAEIAGSYDVRDGFLASSGSVRGASLVERPQHEAHR